MLQIIARKRSRVLVHKNRGRPVSEGASERCENYFEFQIELLLIRISYVMHNTPHHYLARSQ
jgi:hypothetical protein